MKALLQAIREACSAATWSRGVELARANAVVLEREDGGELELRVSTKGGLVAPLVSLFVDDEDWACDCNSGEDACAHAAAAVIAVNQAKREGRSLAAAAAGTGKIAYRLDGRTGKLVLHRVIASEAGETPIVGSLATVAKKGPKFIATEPDLEFERRLGTAVGGLIPRSQMRDVLTALSKVEDLTLDGHAITIAHATSGLCLRVTDVADGVLVRLEQDGDIAEIFENGAVRKGTEVMAIGGHGLAEGLFAELRRGKVYEARDVGTLVGDILPQVRRNNAVHLDAHNLPAGRTARPRLRVHTERIGDELEVMATLVYGDPAIARVDGDRLTLLQGDEVPIRNTRLERGLIDQLKRDLGIEPGVRKTLSASQAIDTVASIAALEGKAELSGGGHEAFFAAGDLVPRLRVDPGGTVEVWFEPASGEGPKRRVAADAVLRAWESGEGVAPLMSGGFGNLPLSWLGEHGHRVAGLLAAREADPDKPPPAWAAADLALLCKDLDQPVPPALEGLRPLLEGFERIPIAALPEDLTAELREYQHSGIAWLQFLRTAGLGGLLADDMGLGKTLQALCAMQGRTLVVCPTSVLQAWESQAQQFRPALRVSTYHGANRRLDDDADLVLTTYSILRLDTKTLADVHWDTVVLDESQAIKNPESKVAASAYRLQADFRLAMTGTPVENRLDDLWSQFHFINRGLLGGRSGFQKRFVAPIALGDPETAAKLRERIRPFVLRRLKSEVAKELPPRTEVVLRCELRDEERQTYDAVRAATRADIAQRLGHGKNVLAMLEALLRLRQAACHPALLPGQTIPKDRDSSKLALLLETLEEVLSEGHKALVFSQWTSLLDLVQPQLAAASIDHVRLDGSTRDRGAVVDAFQADDGPPVMLISLRAGGTGLTLTAADHVFLLDPWWNPAVEDQAADRAHRIGQTKPVLVHRLVAAKTVEERILDLQARKRRLAEAAVGDASQATQITREELLALLD